MSKKCEQCGEELKGKQRKFCNNKCKDTYWNNKRCTQNNTESKLCTQNNTESTQNNTESTQNHERCTQKNTESNSIVTANYLKKREFEEFKDEVCEALYTINKRIDNMAAEIKELQDCISAVLTDDDDNFGVPC